MRALILHGPGDLRVETMSDPTPGPGEIVVRTERAMTCGTDVKILRAGRHPAMPDPPTAFGHELTGEVVAVGAGVRTPAVGTNVVVANSAPCGSCRLCRRGRPSLCDDLVYLWGAFAEYVRIPARIVARNTLERPPALSVDRAPLVEPLACAISAVRRSTAGPDDDVVIIGGGVQGQLLTACLAPRGCRIVVCDPHAERRDRAVRFGAVAGYAAPREATDVAALRATVFDGRGADVVFEAVGRPHTWQIAVDVAGAGGEVNLYGGCPMDSVVTWPTAPLHYAELRVQGSYHHTPDAIREALRMLMTSSAPFDELVGPPIGLDDVAAALAESGVKRPVIP